MNLLVVADMHVGSKFALWPEDMPNSAGNIPKLNKGQEYLGECWQHHEKLTPKKLDWLILMGDMLNGNEAKDEGRGLTEVDPVWQARAVAALLEPLRKRAKHCLYLKGSNYHAGVAGSDEEALAHTLNAEADAVGQRARDWEILDIGGVYLDLAHTASVVMVNRAMPMERELRYAQTAAADDQRPQVDMIARAHAHIYLWLNMDGVIALRCPAWKLQDTYVQRSITPNRMRSRLIGSVLLNIQPEKKKPDVINRAEYIQHTLLSYRHPPKKAISA